MRFVVTNFRCGLEPQQSYSLFYFSHMFIQCLLHAKCCEWILEGKMENRRDVVPTPESRNRDNIQCKQGNISYKWISIFLFVQWRKAGKLGFLSHFTAVDSFLNSSVRLIFQETFYVSRNCWATTVNKILHPWGFYQDGQKFSSGFSLSTFMKNLYATFA